MQFHWRSAISKSRDLIATSEGCDCESLRIGHLKHKGDVSGRLSQEGDEEEGVRERGRERERERERDIER